MGIGEILTKEDEKKRKLGMENIYFVTSNQQKYEEVEKIFDYHDKVLKRYDMDIHELQTNDVEKLIKQKALSAYKEIRRPLIVEHTALYVKAFEELPGLQTSHFYAQLGCGGIVDYCKYKDEFKARAETVFCYCDGKRYVLGKGIAEGNIKEEITDAEKNKEGFAWDTIFKPNDHNNRGKTYDELKEEKVTCSMRTLAWRDLKKNLENTLSQENDGKSVDDEQENLTKLAKLLREKKVMLFVGAGISASVGLPTWNALIREMGEKDGFDAELFESHGDNMMLAEYVGLRDEEWTDQKNETLYEFLKEKMDINKNTKIKEELEKSELYEILANFHFPVIYTTNYDHLLEKYFDMSHYQYKKIVSIDDMEDNTNDKDVTRIMKFHGDIDKKDSIVLSESQYFERMDFKSFMDVLLQADIMKYHILFLGYSLSDINIKLLLYLARKRWEGSESKKEAFIFTATPNKIQKAVFKRNGIVTFSGSDADKKEGTLNFLRELKEKYEDIKND